MGQPSRPAIPALANSHPREGWPAGSSSTSRTASRSANGERQMLPVQTKRTRAEGMAPSLPATDARTAIPSVCAVGAKDRADGAGEDEQVLGEGPVLHVV